MCVPPPRLPLSHPARFAFGLIAVAVVSFLIELGTLRENSHKDLRKTIAATKDLHYATEAERYFLPDDFVRAGQVLRRERDGKGTAQFDPLLRAVAERGPAALDEEELRQSVNRLSQSQRIALVLMFCLPDDALKSTNAVPIAEKILDEENTAAIRRIVADPQILQGIRNETTIRADLDFDDERNRHALYRVIQGRLLGGSEVEFHKFTREFAEDPPVKPLSFARQLALAKELDFMFLIGRGKKVLPYAEHLLDGYFIRNPILRKKLKARIDTYEKKAAAKSATPASTPRATANAS